MIRPRPRGVRAGCLSTLLALALVAMAVPAAQAATFTVNTFSDTTEVSTCTGVESCSLRQAVQDAGESSEAANTIELPEGTYQLTHGALEVNPAEKASLRIAGESARADKVVISAGKASGVMRVGAAQRGAVVSLSKVEITEGVAPAAGGGIYVYPATSLTVEDSEVAGNESDTSGGGIDTNGALAVIRSTIRGNVANGGLAIGGGVDNFAENAGVKVINSTLTGNEVKGGSVNAGSAINNSSVLEVVNSTISRNTAPAEGGALAGGAETLQNTILTSNAGNDCSGTAPVSKGGNVFDDLSCSLHASKDLAVISAKLAPLAWVGGPTEMLELLPTSEAAYNGIPAGCPLTDQRGLVRGHPADPSEPTCSAGAYEAESPGLPTLKTVTGEAKSSAGGTLTASSESVGASCAGAQCTVEQGAKVKLSEAANPGYRLKSWGGACAGNPTSISFCDVFAQENLIGSATFAQRLTVSAIAEASTRQILASDSSPSASCSGASCMVDEGDTVKLEVTPDPYVQFTHWTSGPCAGTSTNPCVIANVTSSVTAIAAFAVGPPPPPESTLVIYVSASTGNDANVGTSPAAPLRTSGQAVRQLENFAAHERRGSEVSQMRFAEGNYEALELNGEENGLAIYGDLNPNTWEAVAAPQHPTTFSGSPQALLLNGTREVSFQQLDLVGTPDAQRSAYGARLLAHATATFSDVQMVAAAGVPGPSGGNGVAGAPGAAGREGEAGKTPGEAGNYEDPYLLFGDSPVGFFNAGGGEGGAGAPGGPGGHGGAGSTLTSGTASYNGPEAPGAAANAYCAPSAQTGCPSSGEWIIADGSFWGHEGGSDEFGSPPGGGGGTQGQGSYNGNGHPGEKGAPGGAGNDGSSGESGANSSAQGTAWSPGAGSSGARGIDGSGGGGGGGGGGNSGLFNDGVGNGGGGGGAGGDGGDGGGGGNGGGGSFGLYLAEASTATVQLGSVISAGNGGNGGNGGVGGSGGAGGAGGRGGTHATPEVGAGGNGGKGGSGGGGGFGGGGAGGPSYAVYTAGLFAGATLSEDSTLQAGTPGAGGAPGVPGATPPGEGGGGGHGHACSATCGIGAGLANLPVFSSYAVVTGLSFVTTTIECPSACGGTVTLVYSVLSGVKCKTTQRKLGLCAGKAARVTARRSRPVRLGSARFKAKARTSQSVRIRIDGAARTLLKHHKQLAAQLHVVVKVGSAKATSYTVPVILTHTKPVHPKSVPRR